MTELAVGATEGLRLYKLRRQVFAAFRYTLLLLFVVIFVGPMILVVMSALKSTAEVAQDPLSLPTTLHFENFVKAWTTGQFGSYLGNTVVYTVFTVAGVCLLASLAGYALARLKFPGRSALLVLVVLGLMIPFQSIMISLYYLLNDLHLLGTYPAMIVSGIALGVPFGAFLMRAFFSSLPEEVAEAARLDGCTEWGVFRRVMLPLAGPGLATLAVIQFLATWNAFILPLVTVPADKFRPVAVGLIFFQGRFTADHALISAAILLMNIPVLVAYLLLRRQFIRGVSAGAASL